MRGCIPSICNPLPIKSIEDPRMNSTLQNIVLLAAAVAATGAYAQEGTPAIIVAGDEAVLSAQMAGRIQKINVGLGTAFAAGTVLVEFECAERQAQLDAAKAESLGARETHLAKLRLQG